MIKKLSTYILNLLFPKECLGCKKQNTYICARCGEKLPGPDIDENSSKIMAAVSYDSLLIKKAIRALKYRKVKQMAEPLARLIYERLFKTGLVKESPLPRVLVPAPLSKKSLRKRGFNQAESIAGFLSDMTGIEVLTNVLYKNRDTVSQVDLKERGKRLKNLKGAFSVKNPELIKNKVVFVVDDVSTTGATINEARRVLLAAGAGKVTGIVVAR